MSMRPILKWFTASNLLLLPLTIAISFSLMVLLVQPPKTVYAHSIAYASVRQLNKQLATIDLEFEMSIEPNERQAAFGSWLAGTLNQPTELAKRLGDQPDLDPWGNSYRFVRNQISGKDSFGVYSVGRDGRSDSAGSDTDDLNSWDDTSGEIYARDVFAEGMKQILWLTAIMTPLLFVALRRVFRQVGLMKTPESTISNES